MKNIIFYFTGTGNSLYTAKKISEKTGNPDIIKITSSAEQKIADVEADILGFVFPVYAFGPPASVERFIKKITIIKANYSFIAVTHGGGPADALLYTEKLFNEKNHRISCWFEIKMPSNYIIASDVAPEEKIIETCKLADSQIGQMTDMIISREKGPVPGSRFGGKLKTNIVHPLFVKNVQGFDKKFYFQEKCTGCGICARICPVDNIKMTYGKKPEWQHKCEQCLACINWCPEEAIQYGKGTLKRHRYHHSGVKVSELMN